MVSTSKSRRMTRFGCAAMLAVCTMLSCTSTAFAATVKGDDPIDFCATMDALVAATSSPVTIPLIDALGDDFGILELIACATADLNGASTTGVGGVLQTSPNGIGDGGFEFGVLAELLYAPDNYTALASGTATGQLTVGVDSAAIVAAYQHNYDALFIPFESKLETLPVLVTFLAPELGTLSQEDIDEVLALFPNLFQVLAAYATLGDTNSVALVTKLTTAINEVLDGFSPLPVTPDAFMLNNGILGPSGNADGDGFTNLQERSGNGSPSNYVLAALDPELGPGTEGEGEGEGEDEFHSADTDENNRISISELLRVIQLYNVGGYSCGVSEDGYLPVAGDCLACGRHDSDFDNVSCVISLSELLRLIQFMNVGGYVACGTSEDGFCPSPVTL